MAYRVLLAEDEPNIVESISFLLQRAGYEVIARSEGPDALKDALGGKPDVLILDVMLPGMDGFEVLRRLREDPAGRGIPVIMLTAKGQREDREAALKSGADVFITKPFSNAEVMEAVKQLCSRSRPTTASGASGTSGGR